MHNEVRSCAQMLQSSILRNHAKVKTTKTTQMKKVLLKKASRSRIPIEIHLQMTLLYQTQGVDGRGKVVGNDSYCLRTYPPGKIYLP